MSPEEQQYWEDRAVDMGYLPPAGSASITQAWPECDDNPPSRFGGYPTVFAWCSKSGNRRARQEAENLRLPNSKSNQPEEN